VSLSPNLLACNVVGDSRRGQRRQNPVGRRSCATAPASPALTACSSMSSSGARQGLGRRASNTEEVATLVVKNLSLDFRKEDVVKYLTCQGATAQDVELHVDPASGAFRGTVFVRYAGPATAREALAKLGSSPEIGGRKARVEIQKSKNLFGRKSPAGELPQELAAVQQDIEDFIRDTKQTEVCLSVAFDAHQRKYAHSLAERHYLIHATRQNEAGATYVYLSKWRSSPQPVGNRKKAHSMDVQTAYELRAGSDLLGDRGYEAGSQSCFVGPMSPPGLVPGLDFPLPACGIMDDTGMFMLPMAAEPVPPPGIDFDFDFDMCPGAPGLPLPLPSAVLSSLAMLGGAPGLPGLEGIESLWNELSEDPKCVEQPVECNASGSSTSVEDDLSKDSDDTDLS